MKYNFPNIDLESGFLNALSPAVRNRITAKTTMVDLPSGKPIFLNHGDISYAYFPLSAVVSIQSETHDGSTYEVCEVGREGLVGLAMFMSNMAPPQAAIVCTKGKALRINGEYLLEEFDRGEEFASYLFRYIHVVVNSVSQSVICGRLHHADQRLCRWLLATLDRIVSNQIFVTHELLANVLGVNREFVTLTLKILSRRGAIKCSRGLIEVIDREDLLRQSCECYSVNRKELLRLNNAKH